jgi:maltose-binding protein MalE
MIPQDVKPGNQLVRRTAIGFLVFVIAAGCSTDATGPPPPPAPAQTPAGDPSPAVDEQLTPTPGIGGDVVIWLDWTPNEMGGLAEAIQAFRTRHPDINFSIGYRPGRSLYDDFVEAGDTSEKPTILLGPSPWGPTLMEDGLIMDLSDYVDSELQRSILPLAWSQTGDRRTILAVPIELHGMVLYRNTGLISERVRDVDGFIRRANEQRDLTGMIMPLDFGFFNSAAYFAACNGSLFNPEGDLSISTEAGFCWMELLNEMSRAGRVVFNEGVDRSMFEEGKSGWFIAESDMLSQLSTSLGAEHLAVDRWPVYTKSNRSLAGFVWTENAYLVSGSSNVDLEASWGFMRFLLTPEAQEILSNPDGAAHLPVIFNVHISDRLKSEALSAVQSGIPRPLRSDLDKYIQPIENAIEDFVVMGADLQISIDVALMKIEDS